MVVMLWAIHYFLPFMDYEMSNSYWSYNMTMGLVQIFTLWGAQPVFLVGNDFLFKVLTSMWMVNWAIFSTNIQVVYANLSVVLSGLTLLYVCPFARCGVGTPFSFFSADSPHPVFKCLLLRK